MQMSFFDFEEFNELKAEAKKKEAPRKKKEEKQKKKSAPKTVYKLPLTLKTYGTTTDDCNFLTIHFFRILVDAVDHL